MDFYTNSTFQVQKGQGSRLKVNFGNPLITFEGKFGTDIENGPSLRTDHKTTPKWSWPGSHDLISKFWDPLNNL